MVEALTTRTKLLVVHEIQEDDSGARVGFQPPNQGYLSSQDAHYATYLRLARSSNDRQQPIGVSFGADNTITELIRADNDIPSQIWEEKPNLVQVLFQGHDGVFRYMPSHPEAGRIRAVLDDALRRKVPVWFITHKADLALLDVLPAV